MFGGFLQSCFRHLFRSSFSRPGTLSLEQQSHKELFLVPLCGSSLCLLVMQKNEMRYSQQAESSAIRCSYSLPKLPIGWRHKHVHARIADLYPGDQLAVNQSPVSTRNRFHNPSHSCECGAFRFLLWWLFLHRRLRFGNEAQLSLSRFAPFGGSLPLGATRFYPNGSRKSRNFL